MLQWSPTNTRERIMPTKVIFFDTKPYDKEAFEQVNHDFGFEIKYFTAHLTRDTAELAHGADAVCVFVNDAVDSEVAEVLAKSNVGIIALRCAGFNNVDPSAVKGRFRVVRVPAYSPHAVVADPDLKVNF